MTRDEAIKVLSSPWLLNDDVHRYDERKEAVEMAIEALKCGKWIRTKHDLAQVHPATAVWYRCSECNMPALENRQTLYCPNCGAKMITTGLQAGE